jgi:hypothetical protein
MGMWTHHGAPYTLNGQRHGVTFFHPDSTVGPGFSPDLPPLAARGLSTLRALPPVGNFTLP